MTVKTVKQIREMYLSFFKGKQHTVVTSSPLVPEGDDTLLFTNAGMVQFKDVFLGTKSLGFSRATSAQCCVRAGGKHNDLENVGYTARHHTFFEMLGNFSFGDYFKKEAISFAWKFLTEVLHIAPEKLWVTVYFEDKEAENIWIKDIGVDPKRISHCGEKDNFWSMGDTGPCGPCTEIFYDHGPSVPGGPPGSPDADGDRYIEVWNLVFMQYNRDTAGVLHPLPKPAVDTGMGLERIAAVMQGVKNNYDIDLFQRLIHAAMRITGAEEVTHPSLRVIADHLRTAVFLIAEGVLPGPEGRSYVLRRIIRRALRHGRALGAPVLFFHKLVGALVTEMGEAYPLLIVRKSAVEKALQQEETLFGQTLDQGMKIFENTTATLAGTEIPGHVAFKLYDTYGFPLDLTMDMAREKGLIVEMVSFEIAMEAQRARAKAANAFGAYRSTRTFDAVTTFTGYTDTIAHSIVQGIFQEDNAVERLDAGMSGCILIDKTPFYAESGGQVGDTGILEGPAAVFLVQDTRRSGAAILHYGTMQSGSIQPGIALQACVDSARRHATALNHSATHLLHAVLREVLGPHVQQKGSLVNAEVLRFDFSHGQALTVAERQTISDAVNARIWENSPVHTEEVTMELAKERGAMALFGEKYGDVVRVLSMAEDFSVELCGGTHVIRTGDIGLFVLTAEMGVAAGVRRIEACTGRTAYAYLQAKATLLDQAAMRLKTTGDTVPEKVASLQQQIREFERVQAALVSKKNQAIGEDLLSLVVKIKDISLLAVPCPSCDPKALRDLVDRLKQKIGSGIIVLGTVYEGKISLVAGVTADYMATISAKDVVNVVAHQVGGQGGGRADMAQAGGTDVDKLDAALASVQCWLAAR